MFSHGRHSEVDVDADCHDEEMVTVSDWIDCAKLLLETQHLWESVSLCVKHIFQIY